VSHIIICNLCKLQEWILQIKNIIFDRICYHLPRDKKPQVGAFLNATTIPLIIETYRNLLQTLMSYISTVSLPSLFVLYTRMLNRIIEIHNAHTLLMVCQYLIINDLHTASMKETYPAEFLPQLLNTRPSKIFNKLSTWNDNMTEYGRAFENFERYHAKDPLTMICMLNRNDRFDNWDIDKDAFFNKPVIIQNYAFEGTKYNMDIANLRTRYLVDYTDALFQGSATLPIDHFTIDKRTRTRILPTGHGLEAGVLHKAIYEDLVQLDDIDKQITALSCKRHDYVNAKTRFEKSLDKTQLFNASYSYKIIELENYIAWLKRQPPIFDLFGYIFKKLIKQGTIHNNPLYVKGTDILTEIPFYRWDT
jgi:hypothetical protein